MIQLTDTDGDTMFIRREFIAIIFEYSAPTERPGVVKQQMEFTREPKSILCTPTGMMIHVLETTKAIRTKMASHPWAEEED